MSFLTRGEDYLAKAPKFRLVGRDAELKKLSSILVRNMANSVLLVGPGGVGCTALCMGLQASKKDPDAPFDIVNKRLFWLDTDALFSSGDPVSIRESFQRMMGTLDRTPDSVLIIEDTRDFIEAARNVGTLHFINALCLAIKSKKTQVILEARDEDLDVILKSHSDLRELFTLVDLAEPEGEALFQIVAERAEHLQEFHRIRIAESALRTAIDLTSKYRSRDAGMSRAQPERSVSLLDRALSTYRLGAHRRPPGLEEAEATRKAAKTDKQLAEAETALAQVHERWGKSQERIKALYKRQRDGEVAVLELEEELDKQLEAETAARQSPAESPVGEITGRIAKFARLATGAGIESDAVRDLKQRIGKFQEEITTNRAAFDALTKELNDHLELSRDIVLREFSQISGISVSKLNENEREKLRNLETELKSRIFGQDHVVRALSNAVKTARVGRRNQDRPQASFMFLGPSGVGKTEMAKALAASLLDDEKALTRFDMSEYMEKHAVSRLIGAPPGYEGFEAGGILTNAMRKNPLRVLLFDEIEKAHPDVFNVFLQILSDGRLTDNVGRTVSFSESIIIMTTNIGQPHFLNPKFSLEEANAEAIREIEKTYRSEFLNRFAGRQNIICFNKLDLPSIEKIVRREFDGMDRTYGQEGIKITVAEADLKAFCKGHYDPAIGARGLPGFIQANIEPIIVNMILESDKRGPLDLAYNPKRAAFEIRPS
ncbi:AAA family ATPase [Taklimakanibacter lacteus]|uniref:AAA family ATPase n=1 Tax=Taklimakanibacter lacteus TaxID=2268456 RepID=UPI000E66FCC9